MLCRCHCGATGIENHHDSSLLLSTAHIVMDKYVKIKKIGEGSFGVAYLARYKDGKECGKQVVLKEINMTKVS